MTKALLIHSDNFVINIAERLKKNLYCFDTSKLATSETWKDLDKQEKFCHDVCLQLDDKKYADTDFIVLDKNQLNCTGWDLSIYLASHIRLHPFKSTALATLPIVLTYFDLPDIASDKSLTIFHKIPGFPTAKGFYFKKYSDIFVETSDINGEPCLQLFSISGLIRRKIDLQTDLLKPIPTVFEVVPPRDDRHGIANEWGAFKLAASFNHDINYQLPQSLYFKYLTAKFSGSGALIQYNNLTPSQTIAETILTQEQKVLLIDDNAKKGWREALEKVLPAQVHDKEFADDVDLDILNQYSLIFLDLRLPANCRSNPDTSTAIELLSKIKGRYPYLPVIVFTASNKVWNYKALLHSGADGYFIKESPENLKDSTFSQQNRESLSDITKNCIVKGKTLKPYWEGINEILEIYTTLVQDRTNISYLALFRDRIKERLLMFFGLLKRGYEDSAFNKDNFFYSDNELAFMTLWSTLNEISDAYYIRRASIPTTLTLADGNGIPVTHHPDGNPIRTFNQPLEEWQLKNQQEFLFKYRYKFEGFELNGQPKTLDSRNRFSIKRYVESNLKHSKDLSPPYELVTSDFNPYQTLHMQIAYLLLAKNELKTNGRVDLYLNDLYRLNNIRNSLYLTHGDAVTSGFYSQVEKDKRSNSAYNIKPDGDIKNLFELVAFLLTAKNMTITL